MTADQNANHRSSATVVSSDEAVHASSSGGSRGSALSVSGTDKGVRHSEGREGLQYIFLSAICGWHLGPCGSLSPPSGQPLPASPGA